MASLATHVFRALSETGSCLGFEVIGTEDLSESRGEVLREALLTIQQHAPWILAHARRDLDALVIITSGGTRFVAPARSILVSTERMDYGDSAWIALGLVFAMTEARIHTRYGTKRISQFRRSRLSFEKQLAFARRLPDSFSMVEHLSSAWRSGWFNADNQEQLKQAEMRDLGLPEWLIGGLIRLRRLAAR